jgi:hypothetical protein
MVGILAIVLFLIIIIFCLSSTLSLKILIYFYLLRPLGFKHESLGINGGRLNAPLMNLDLRLLNRNRVNLHKRKQQARQITKKTKPKKVNTKKEKIKKRSLKRTKCKLRNKCNLGNPKSTSTCLLFDTIRAISNLSPLYLIFILILLFLLGRYLIRDKS